MDFSSYMFNLILQSALSNKYNNKKIILRGALGCGKTTVMLRLFMDDGSIIHSTFHYVSASIFEKRGYQLTNYEKMVKKAIKENTSINGTILIDGLEEEYESKPKEAIHFFDELKKTDNNIWIACRPEFLEKMDTDIVDIFDDIADVKEWSKENFNDYIANTKDEKTKNRIQEMIKNNPDIELLVSHNPLYATILVFISKGDIKINAETLQNEYDLLKLFTKQWIQREKKKKNGKHTILWYQTRLSDISINVLHGVPCSINKELGVAKGLLKVRETGTVLGFYHKAIETFFIVEGMLNSAIKKPDDIVKYYFNTFTDEITNLCKTALRNLDKNNTQKIYTNLFNIYRESYDNKTHIEELFKKNKITSNDLSFLKLRDEILYFILKLEGIDNEDFIEYANAHKGNDTMLELGLAYGVTGQRQHSYTLSFAKKLNGENENAELVNRSWAMCFFGDKKEDGFTYRDNEKCEWTRVKNAKLQRLKKNEPKYYRYRLLDIPLLYCFYKSRDFRDCISYKDYQLLSTCKIDYENYSDQEREFIEQQRKQLSEAYLGHMLKNTIDKNMDGVVSLMVDGTVYDEKSGCIRINDKVKEKILEYVKINEETMDDLKAFWEERGKKIRKDYEKLTVIPDKTPINQDLLENKLKDCTILILSANEIEGAVINRCLMKENDTDKLEVIDEDKQSYCFSQIQGIPIVHIWPMGTSSFTQHGSFNALMAAFSRFTPDKVFSVGVAFGIDPNSQRLGDVLIADHLVFYDYFNKVTDGKIQLNADEVQEIGDRILNSCRALSQSDNPRIKQIGDFSWHKGTLLTGGSVISDPVERKRLCDAAGAIGRTIIGGEMEGSGIWFACNSAGKSIPFTIVKGICDWAVNKNGWSFAVNEEDENKKKKEQKTIKDCIQAYACENAYKTIQYIISQIYPQSQERQSP